MAGARFVPNPALIPNLLKSRMIGSRMLVAAEIVAARARQLVPVDTGALQESIEAEASIGEARVWARTSYATYVEFGTSDTPAFAYLRGAAGSVGI